MKITEAILETGNMSVVQSCKEMLSSGVGLSITETLTTRPDSLKQEMYYDTTAANW